MFLGLKNGVKSNRYILFLFLLTLILFVVVSSVSGADVTVSGNSFTSVESSFNSGDIVHLGSKTYVSDGNKIDVDVNNFK
ncbi:hypothetical protein [Methanobrevibacter filiformis]|uniref:Uncharacterized protein n=1 Tax=Methanobrevibacter filiformis TaxID=55758 RepID=A0A166F1C6_9EURY|nr:hypothetical protein [Methanobrevibacter filiformis]KZX17219.1 hypothetical protein MBFIL_02890 [Methanobrevibacter filiformis]